MSDESHHMRLWTVAESSLASPLRSRDRIAKQLSSRQVNLEISLIAFGRPETSDRLWVRFATVFLAQELSVMP